MQPKPDDCIGCSWYGDGEGFVPDEVVPGSQAVFVCQNPGESEEAQGKPLVGKTGQMFRGRFVKKHLDGVPVSYANVIKCRHQSADGRRSNSMPTKGGKEWQEIVARCRPYLDKTLAKVPGAVVVPMGEHAALALTGIRAKAMLHLRGTVVEE